MDYETHIERLKRDGARLSAISSNNLDAPVPSCPDWTVEDLVRHTGAVYMHKIGVMRAGGTERPAVDFDDGPEDRAGLLSWFEGKLDELVTLLEARSPEEPCWNFYGTNTTRFWARRMALETAVHRWDAEAAAGSLTPIEPDLAADGVDEMLNVMIPADEIDYEGPEGTVHLHATDTEGEWTIELKRGSLPLVRSGHEKGDAAVRAGAGDLLLLVWRRTTPDTVETFGDREVLDGLWNYLNGPGQ